MVAAPTDTTPLAPDIAIQHLARAQSRDEIVAILCRASSRYAPYCAFLSVKGDELKGRMALAGEWIDRASLPTVSLRGATPLRTVADAGTAQPVELGGDDTSRALLVALGRRTPMRAALIPLVLRKRTMAMLYLDRDGKTILPVSLGELAGVIATAERAFESLLAHGKVIESVTSSAPAPQRVLAEEVSRDPRVAMSVEINMESEHNFYTGITGNISSGGLFVATYTPPPRDTEVELDLTIEEGVHRVRGKVCWIRDAANATELSPAGCGLLFGELSASAATAIRAFVAKRDSIFYDDDD